MIRITIYSGFEPGDNGEGDDAEFMTFRKPAVSTLTVQAQDVHEELRQIGLEWKTADYMPGRQVVITLDPVQQPVSGDDLPALLRDAAERLEQ